MNGYGTNIICLFLNGVRERMVLGRWKNPCVRTGTLTVCVCGGGTSKYDLAFLFYCIKRFVNEIL